jgi:hypothetical protein
MSASVRKTAQQSKRKTSTEPTTIEPTSPEGSEREAFVSRLRVVADQLGGGRALARAAEVFPSTARAWFSSAEPGRAALRKIARAARVSLDWLVDGEGNYARLRFHDLRRFPYAEAWFANKESLAPETRLFDLSALIRTSPEENSLSRKLEAWTDPTRAAGDLFMVLVDGCGDKMDPLIRDGDFIVASQSGANEADYRPGRAFTYPCVIAHRGKVIVRLIRYGANFTAIGPTEKTSWPPKMAWPPEHMMKGIAPAPPIGEFFPMGRVIWCGRSLLSLDFD